MEATGIRIEGSQTRCPYCHDSVSVESQEWLACSRCLARHHVPCWSERGRCASCEHGEPLGRGTRELDDRARAALAAMARHYAGAPRRSKLRRVLEVVVTGAPTLGVYPLIAAELRLARHRRRNAAEAGESTPSALGGALARLALIAVPFATVCLATGFRFAGASLGVPLVLICFLAPLLAIIYANFFRSAVRRHELDQLSRPGAVAQLAPERLYALHSSWERRAIVDFALMLVGLGGLFVGVPVAFAVALAALIRVEGAVELHEKHEEELARNLASAEAARPSLKA